MNPRSRLGAGVDTGADSAVVRLVVPNHFSELERVSVWLRDFARERGLAHEQAFGLDLAVAEALTNVMSYAYCDVEQHDIVVELRSEPDRIRVRIEDDGVPFNPLDPPPADEPPHSLDEAQPTGRGIPLMHSFMSELHYLRRDDRNVLTMIVNCAKR